MNGSFLIHPETFVQELRKLASRSIAMPTNDEINAGFDALEPDLEKVVSQFVPSFFQGSAMQTLRGPQGRAVVVDGVRRVLIAAEGVRAKAAAKVATPAASPPKASSPR
jgi:hypothetical protein